MKKFLGTVFFAAICSALVWGYFTFFQHPTYQLSLVDPTPGLRVNTPVTFNGVVVGKVSKITFDRHNPREVTVLMQVHKDTPLSQGTRAQVAHPFIHLNDQGKDQRPFTVLDGQRYPNITMTTEKKQVTPSNNNRTKAIEEISKNLSELNASFKKILSDENAESLQQVFYSLQQVSGVLAANSEKLDSLLKNSEKASSEFEPFLQKGKETVQMLRTQTLPEAHQLVQNLNEALAVLQQLGIKLNNNPTVLIRGEHPPRLGPGEVLQH